MDVSKVDAGYERDTFMLLGSFMNGATAWRMRGWEEVEAW